MLNRQSKWAAAILAAICFSGAMVNPVRADDAATTKHTFTFGGTNNEEFLLDGKPFQMIAGEMHPARIPAEYWRHRIQMVKALGFNTIPIYIFWNDHEREEGKFDFTTDSRNIGEFLKIAKEEGMWVAFRPGPYCCGEWDFGGIPTYLLKHDDIKIRTIKDKRYLDAVERYFTELAKIVKPNLVENGGSIIMVQIENEFGSYGRPDRPYLEWVRDLWIKLGVKGPFFQADGAGNGYLKDTVMPGVAVGLDSGTKEEHWELVRKLNPGVPIFSAETYPGWLRHWGEKDWPSSDVTGITKWYMDNKKSFNFYVIHGGTNFGFTAGANTNNHGYTADVTSYDYGAPIDEQGNPTKNYIKLRELMQTYQPDGKKLPEMPAPIPSVDIPEIKVERWSDLWSNLPEQLKDIPSPQDPPTFESMDQNQGMVLYRTKLPVGGERKLTFTKVSDIAQIFVDGQYIGMLDRSKGQREITLPATAMEGTLDILVEGMGHINFTRAMESDRKGITSPKIDGDLINGWQVAQFPLTDAWITSVKKSEKPSDRVGGIFKGTFNLDKPADTFIDTTGWTKGVLWVNGRNLGRYWDIGPQKKLYCPATWLKAGANEIIILEQVNTEAKPLKGVAKMR